MAGWLHGVCVIVCAFVPPQCGFSLSLVCNYLGRRAFAVHSRVHMYSYVVAIKTRASERRFCCSRRYVMHNNMFESAADDVGRRLLDRTSERRLRVIRSTGMEPVYIDFASSRKFHRIHLGSTSVQRQGYNGCCTAGSVRDDTYPADTDAFEL